MISGNFLKNKKVEKRLSRSEKTSYGVMYCNEPVVLSSSLSSPAGRFGPSFAKDRGQLNEDSWNFSALMYQTQPTQPDVTYVRFLDMYG